MKTVICTLFYLLCVSANLLAQDTPKAFDVAVAGTGPALFLIPGAACSGEVWEKTVERYQSQYTCHVFTLAGYAGVPALDRAPMLEEMKIQLLAYINQHKSPESVLMGHSIGGWLSLLMASEQTDLVTRIIIVDALPFLPAANNPNLTEEQAEAYPVEAMLAQYEAMDSSSFANVQQQIIASMVKREALRPKVLQWSLASSKKAMAHTMHEMMTRDLRQEVGKIQAEALILCAWDQGTEEARNRHMQLYRNQYQALKGATLVPSENASHFIMLDNPQWYFKQIDQFLQQSQP